MKQKSFELPQVYLSISDAEQLRSLLLQTPRGPSREYLEDELSRAEILPAQLFPPDIVKVNSLVRFVDEESGEKRELTLVLPGKANIQEGRISVLAPVGIALLGLPAGQSISWPVPGGGHRILKILEVFQPKSVANPGFNLEEHPP